MSSARNFHVHFISGVLVILTLFHGINWPGSDAAALGIGHSSLKLFQGAKKFELDAQNCPVGVAFNQPERFSCACINGIFAFYSNPCSAPVAVIGGNHHCFRMPPQVITSIVIVSNPLRGLSDSLTVFEGDMNTVRTKFYRNVRMYMSEANGFVSLNSSWTLFSPDGSRSICLDKKDVIFEGLTSEEASAFPDMTYCSFVDVSREMPFVGSVRRGCNSSMILEPAQCQPMLPRTDEEDVCMDANVVSAYEALLEKDLDPVTNSIYEEFDSDTHKRPNRALENLGRFAAVRRRNVEAAPPPKVETTTPKYASAYQGQPEWHQRLLAKNGNSPGVNKGGTPSGDKSPPGHRPIPIDMVKAWNSSQVFLAPQQAANDSNQLVTNHLWMYYRYAIRNALNITRLVPPDEEMYVRVDTGKVKKLLNVHIEIMKRLCSLAPPFFLEAVTGTFVGLLTKGFRWKEPYVEQTHYLRILTSLTSCKNNAQELKFVREEACSPRVSNFILMPDTNGEGQVNVEVTVPGKFHSERFEPIIEATWKIFVAVHSYCFKDFSEQYQDHHKYTTLMMGLFSNQVHDIWMRNKTMKIEYAGILGNVGKTMKDLERCVVGARMTSEYPFHMSRPTKMFKFRDENEISVKKRRKRDLQILEGMETYADNVPHSRKKRLAISAVNSENIVGHTVFAGRGICLKKYTDSKNVFGKTCKREKHRE